MGRFTETLSSILSKLVEWLGLKSSRVRRYQLEEERLLAERARYADRLETLKEEIQKILARVLQLKQEHEKAPHDIKRIIARQIEQTFREIDRKRGLENIIMSKIERVSVAVAKIEELIAALETGVSEDTLDTLALELQEAFAEMKAVDNAIKDFEREQYESPAAEALDVKNRMSKLEGSENPEGKLSDEALERLKQLEAEKEKVQVRKATTEPSDVDGESLQKQQVVLPGLPPIPTRIVELEGELEEIEATINKLEEGTYPSLWPAQDALREAEKQSNHLKDDLEANTPDIADGPKRQLARKIAQNREGRPSSFCELVPDIDPNILLPYIVRLLNVAKTEKTLQDAKTHYEKRQEELRGLRKRHSETLSRLLALQEKDFHDLLNGFLSEAQALNFL